MTRNEPSDASDRGQDREKIPRPSDSTVRRPAEFDRIPDRIGPYRILEELGAGGMGVVYLAQQETPVRRKVALKVIKLGMDTKEVIARFESERQALAMMNHPNIAKVFDAGSTDSGRPYFVMEYAPGVPITTYCDQHCLPTRERLELHIPVCRAIHHAHQKGIIHRDIKPSNVLVAIEDGRPVPKVIDFGVAKATSHRLTERTVFTEQGRLIGTPEYMSPEQAEMTGLNVDTTTDVYSLGVLLYELLTGALPIEARDLRAAGWSGIQKKIREEEPLRPSTRVSALGDKGKEIAKRRRTEVRTLQRQLKSDLDWVVMRAMDKDRTRRYPSASEFASDIERFLRDEPVQASPPSKLYRLRKFMRRHSGPLAAAVAVMVTIVAMGSLALWQGRVAQERAAYVRANGILASAAATEDPLLKALLVLELEDFPDLPGRLTIAREAADHPLPVTAIQADDTGIWAIAFSPDGSRFATGSRGGLVKIWRSDGTGEPIVLRGHRWGIWDLAFTKDGTRIITASEDSTARVWRVDGLGEPVVLEGHRDGLGALCISPDDRLVATTSADSTVRIWRIDGGGEPIVLDHGSWVSSVEFDSTGTRLLTASRDGLARIWPLQGSGDPLILRGHQSRVLDACFSPDDALVATVSWDCTARIWPSDGTGDPVVLEHEESLGRVEFGPDGSWLATADLEGVVRIWPIKDERDPTVLAGHESWLNGWEISPDGAWIATAGRDGTARIWPTDGTTEGLVLCRQDAEVLATAFSPDGSSVAAASGDGSVKIWRTGDAGEATFLRNLAVWDAKFSPDGSRLATGDYYGTVQVWAADGRGEPLVIGKHEGPVYSVGFSPDGSMIVSGSRDSTVSLWCADGGGEIGVLERHGGWFGAAGGFSPDGALVVTSSFDGRVVVHHTDMSREPITVADQEREVYNPKFTPDGQHILGTSDDDKVRVWSVDGGGEAKVVAEHRGLWGTALSSDGLLLATTSYVDNTCRIWTLGSTDPPTILAGHSNEVYGAAFSPDNRRIVTSSIDNTVRVWDVETGTELLCVRGNNNALQTATFSPDGTRLLAYHRNQARILRVTWEELAGYLRRNAGGCLTPKERERFLGERPSEAWTAYADCERRFERSPPIDRLE